MSRQKRVLGLPTLRLIFGIKIYFFFDQCGAHIGQSSGEVKQSIQKIDHEYSDPLFRVKNWRKKISRPLRLGGTPEEYHDHAMREADGLAKYKFSEILDYQMEYSWTIRRRTATRAFTVACCAIQAAKPGMEELTRGIYDLIPTILKFEGVAHDKREIKNISDKHQLLKKHMGRAAQERLWLLLCDSSRTRTRNKKYCR